MKSWPLLIILTLSFGAFANDLTSCRTSEFDSYFRLSCHVERRGKVFELDYVISKFLMVNKAQAKTFCDGHFSNLDSSFLHLSEEGLIYFDEKLMDHLDGVNIRDRGRTFLNWSDFERDEKLYAICSDIPGGILLDMRL